MDSEDLVHAVWESPNRSAAVIMFSGDGMVRFVAVSIDSKTDRRDEGNLPADSIFDTAGAFVRCGEDDQWRLSGSTTRIILHGPESPELSIETKRRQPRSLECLCPARRNTASRRASDSQSSKSQQCIRPCSESLDSSDKTDTRTEVTPRQVSAQSAAPKSVSQLTLHHLSQGNEHLAPVSVVGGRPASG